MLDLVRRIRRRRSGGCPDEPDEMHNVNYRYEGSLAIQIRHLSGKLALLDTGHSAHLRRQAVFLRSHRIRRIGTTSAALTTLMNQHVFAYEGAPLKKLNVHMDGRG